MVDAEQEGSEELTAEEIKSVEEFYQENYGREVPTLSIGLTKRAIGEAIIHVLFKYGIVNTDSIVTGLVTPIEFDESGHLPVALWIEDREPELDDFLDAGIPRILN